MHLVSKANFAKTIGVSAPYVNKICKEGKITLRNDGKSKKPKVDLHGSLTLEFIKAREQSLIDRGIDPTPPEPETPPQQSTPYRPPPKDPPETTPLKDQDLMEKIEKNRIHNQQTRGALIDKRLVVTVFNKLAGIDENQFKALNVRICPRISAVYTETFREKTAEILKHLGKEKDSELKTEISKILNAGESRRINEITQIIEDDTGAVLKNIQIEFGNFLTETETDDTTEQS